MAAENRANCLFCKIADGNDNKTELLCEDSELVIFRDIHPATDHHYLIVTREHISDARKLTNSHQALVQKMVDVATSFLHERGADTSDVRFGFHWPPFRTIAHLHMHAIAPASSMGFMGRMIFRPGLWFVTADQLLERLA